MTDSNTRLDALKLKLAQNKAQKSYLFNDDNKVFRNRYIGETIDLFEFLLDFASEAHSKIEKLEAELASVKSKEKSATTVSDDKPKRAGRKPNIEK